MLKSQKFDFIIFDNPPSWNQLVISALSFSDILLIPTLLSLSDFEAAIFTIRESKEVNESIIPFVVLNRAAKSESKEEMEYFENFSFGAPTIRFQASVNVKKAIDRNESLELKKHQNLKMEINNFLKALGLIK